MSARNKMFVSYSHKDRNLFKEFKTMLAPAIQKGIVDLWDDQKIQPGAVWKEEIQQALASARVAVLLVSQNFLASEFITNQELPPLFKAAQQDGITIFWIYLSSCLYEQTEIASYQAAHDVSRPLDQLTKARRQALFSEICAKLIRVAQQPAAPANAETTHNLSSVPASSSTKPGKAEVSRELNTVPERHLECCILLVEALESADIAAGGGGPTTALHRRLKLASDWLEKGLNLLPDSRRFFSLRLFDALNQLSNKTLPWLISEARYALPEAGDGDSNLKRNEHLKEVREETYYLQQQLNEQLGGSRQFTALRNSDQKWGILGFLNREDYSSYLYPTVERLLQSTDPMQLDLFERLLTTEEFTPRQLYSEGYRKDIVSDTLNALLKEKWAEWTDLSTLGSGAKAKLNQVGKRLLKRQLGLPKTSAQE